MSADVAALLVQRLEHDGCVDTRTDVSGSPSSVFHSVREDAAPSGQRVKTVVTHSSSHSSCVPSIDQQIVFNTSIESRRCLNPKNHAEYEFDSLTLPLERFRLEHATAPRAFMSTVSIFSESF